MKQEYIKPLAELIKVSAHAAFLEMSGEVNWGMGNQQTIFDEEDSTLPNAGGLWDDDDNSNSNDKL